MVFDCGDKLMASFEVNIDANFIKKLTQLGERTDIVSQMMLDDAGQILGDELEKEIRTKHKDTGELADSIDVHQWKNKDGTWEVWAYPEGVAKSKKMRKGKAYSRSKSGSKTSGKALRNTDKLWFIENGTSKQPARPFMNSMVNNVSGKIIKNMQEIFEREVNK